MALNLASTASDSAIALSQLQQGLPRMSQSLLVQRLKSLEQSGIVERRPVLTGRGFEYHLTEAGKEFAHVVEQSAPFLKQAAVRHLVRERVFERILEIRKQLRLVQELRGLEIVQASPKRLHRQARDTGQ